MSSFLELGISPIKRRFSGKKTKFSEFVDKEVEILDFEIKPSKKCEGSEYCRFQLNVDGVKYYTLTGAKYIVAIMKKISTDILPITTVVRSKAGLYFEGTVED